MRVIFISFVFLFTSLTLTGQGYFTVTTGVESAYKDIISLRMEDARKTINRLKVEEPGNLMIHHLENYIDFFTIFINENRSEFEKLERNKNRRLDEIEKGDRQSPFYLFVQAEINLQWALARVKFDEKLKAASEVYEAYNLLEENVKRFPDFVHNKKSLSILHAVAESLPGWVRRIAGITGSIQLGTREIASVVRYSRSHPFLYKEEAIGIYAYILYYQNNRKEEALEWVTSGYLDPSTSPLACFLIASMAQKNGDNEYAIKVLRQRPEGGAYLPFHYLDLMMGKARLYRLEEGADVDIKKFIKNFKGEHFIKEAYQKLAWYELVINQDVAAYKGYISLCANKGKDLVDEDKQALKEAKSGKIPQPDLLAARLLYDGGYYQRAYNLLIRKSHLFMYDGEIQLEYTYRLGRITQALQNYPDAIYYYSETLERGKDNDHYFACNAALQLGLIMEEQQRYPEAKRYLNLSLDISPKEYKSSLHQKAKTALERVEQKGI